MILNTCSAGHSVSSAMGTLNVTMLWCYIKYQIKTFCGPKINFILCQFLYWYVLFLSPILYRFLYCFDINLIGAIPMCLYQYSRLRSVKTHQIYCQYVSWQLVSTYKVIISPY